MKSMLLRAAAPVLGLAFMTTAASGQMVITAAFDGPLSGGTPKGVEIYVLEDIPDLSQYGIGSANNGGGTDGNEFGFPADSVSAGTFIYVTSEASNFETYFGFAPNYTTGAMGINGDDAVELFFGDTVIDTFGQIDVDPSREPIGLVPETLSVSDENELLHATTPGQRPRVRGRILPARLRGRRAHRGIVCGPLR